MTRGAMKSILTHLPARFQIPVRLLISYFWTTRGFLRYRKWQSPKGLEGNFDSKSSLAGLSNPLQTYFDSHVEGKGIWKWEHYFDIYHRHFAKFIGQDVRILEIGIYSGGSLDMWRQYFGPACRIYGVDIEEACRAYADDSVEVHIGDQADRTFWKEFKKKVALVDIIIDDGGHMPHQQMVTLEEMLPHLRSGGVYLCEDVGGDTNRFAAYMNGLALNLNGFDRTLQGDVDGHGKRLVRPRTQFQDTVHSVHLYPFVAVIEKSGRDRGPLVSAKRGTEWQPFLD